VMLVSFLAIMSLSACFHGFNQTLFARGIVIVSTLCAGLGVNLVLSHLFKHTGEVGFFEAWQIERKLIKTSGFSCLRYRFHVRWRWVWYAFAVGSAIGMIVYILEIALMFDQNPFYYCQGHTTQAWVADFVIPYAISVFVVEPAKIVIVILSGKLRASLGPKLVEMGEVS